jgi:hypothetical protein
MHRTLASHVACGPLIENPYFKLFLRKQKYFKKSEASKFGFSPDTV